MTSRYGRNQRRAARAKIEGLEAALAHEKYTHRLTDRARVNAELRGREAFERAVVALANKHVPEIAAAIGRRIAENLGPELIGPAQRLLNSDPKRERLIPDAFAPHFSAHVSHAMDELVLRGEIKVNYNMVVARGRELRR